MAPEIFENKSYDHNVDIWSLGIFLYELYHNRSPFKAKTQNEIYKNAIKNKIEF